MFTMYFCTKTNEVYRIGEACAKMPHNFYVLPNAKIAEKLCL